MSTLLSEQSVDAKMNLRLILTLSISHLFIDVTGSALPAVMPFFKTALALNYAQIGLVIMLSNLTSSIIQPCFGYFSDRMEIKWLLPLSVVLTYGGFSLTGFAPSFGVLLLYVVVNGMGIAIYHPETFKVTHHFTGSRVATGMSLFQAGGNFGMAFGPLMVTYAMQYGGIRGTLFFIIPGAVILLVLLRCYQELTLPLGSRNRTAAKSGTHAPATLAHPWRSMGFLVAAVTLRSWAHVGLITFAPFYYISILKGDPISAGRLVFAFLIGGALGTVAGGLVADRLGHKPFVSLSLIASVPLLFFFLEASGMWVFILIFIVGFVLISSFSVTVVMGQTLLKDRLGMASGLMLGFVIGVGGIGAGLLGLVADAWGILTVLRLIMIMPAIALLPLMAVNYPVKAR